MSGRMQTEATKNGGRRSGRSKEIEEEAKGRKEEAKEKGRKEEKKKKKEGRRSGKKRKKRRRRKEEEAEGRRSEGKEEEGKKQRLVCPVVAHFVRTASERNLKQSIRGGSPQQRVRCQNQLTMIRIHAGNLFLFMAAQTLKRTNELGSSDWVDGLGDKYLSNNRSINGFTTDGRLPNGGNALGHVPLNSATFFKAN
ncbi:hypothetical protein GPALN_012622 [Globodera pallida]|nr:hypothetical protein GPALN_012622 [Globodera pallida]